MNRLRNYWLYSAALAVVWAVLLTAVFTLRGPATGRSFLLVFGGFGICWVTTTIARYLYPPPKRWRATQYLE